nr:hypothetical protein [Tanacetum cinerariifolium]
PQVLLRLDLVLNEVNGDFLHKRRKFTEPFLRLVGLSYHYTLDEDTYPWFVDRNREPGYMDLFAFIHIPDPTKVRVVERERAKGEPRVLETTVGHTIPLLPVAPNHANSELEASVNRLFDEGVSVLVGSKRAGLLRGFLISSDSSHNSFNASEAEGDSIIRVDVVPPMLTEAITTTQVASVPSTAVPEPGTKACLSVKVRMQTEFCLSERGRFESELEKQTDLLKTKDKEVEDLKAQLFLKEAEAAEAIRLCAEASNFEAM